MKSTLIAWCLCALIAVLCMAKSWGPVPAVRVLTLKPVQWRADTTQSALSFNEFAVVVPNFSPALLRSDYYRALLVSSAQRAFGPHANHALLAAQIHTESAWLPDAKSGAGAVGLAQFMPATAAAMGSRYPELVPVARTDPQWSLLAHSLHMRELLDRYQTAATRCDAWSFALSAYNGGPRMLDAERALARAPGSWLSVRSHRVRRASAWSENRSYVSRVHALHRDYASFGYQGEPQCVTML